MNILDEIQSEHGHDIQQQLISQLGLSRQQAATILPKIGPLILGALKQQKDAHGDDHVHGQVQQLGAADLSDIGALLRGGAESGDADLGGLLGGKGPQASQMIAQRLGISPGTAMKIIPMLAPLIIGMLMKKGRGMPGGTPGAGGGGLGGLGSILDRDGDGQILDDLGALLGGGANKSGCLGTILGGMLRKK